MKRQAHFPRTCVSFSCSFYLRLFEFVCETIFALNLNTEPIQWFQFNSSKTPVFRFCLIWRLLSLYNTSVKVFTNSFVHRLFFLLAHLYNFLVIVVVACAHHCRSAPSRLDLNKLLQTYFCNLFV